MSMGPVEEINQLLPQFFINYSHAQSSSLSLGSLNFSPHFLFDPGISKQFRKISQLESSWRTTVQTTWVFWFGFWFCLLCCGFSVKNMVIFLPSIHDVWYLFFCFSCCLPQKLLHAGECWCFVQPQDFIMHLTVL